MRVQVMMVGMVKNMGLIVAWLKDICLTPTSKGLVSAVLGKWFLPILWKCRQLTLNRPHWRPLRL